MKYLIGKQPTATNTWSVFPYSAHLEKKLTLQSRYGEPLHLFKKSKNNIFVPRAVCPIGLKDMRVEGSDIKFTNLIKPRDADQDKLMAKMVILLQQDNSFILESPTGSGKTVMALNAVARIGKKTMIVVTKSDLMDQWIERAMEHLGLKRSEIGIVRQNKCDVSGKKLIIGMIHSLCMDKYPSYKFADIGLVIWDECHRANAETFSSTVPMFPAKLRLGLSATPDRQDGKEVLFKYHIGPIMVRGKSVPMSPKVIAIKSKWKFPRSWDGNRIAHNPGKSAHITGMLAKSDYRNKLMVKYMLAAYKKDRIQIFFSDLAVEKHLGKIKQLLMKGGVPPTDIGYYVGTINGKASTKKELSTVAGKKIILATFGMMSEGTDIPWLDMCTLGTPRAQVLQPVGRVLREYPNKKQPIVLDFVDIDSPVYKKFYYKRKAQYNKVGADIIEK